MSFSDLITATDRATHDHLGGVAVSYTPDGGSEATTTPGGDPLVGMFDENFVLNDPERPGVEMTAPVITMLLEDLPIDPYDDDPTIKILGVSYAVEQRITDGTIGGSIRLLLHRVAV